jgi:hypothetical protein
MFETEIDAIVRRVTAFRSYAALVCAIERDGYVPTLLGGEADALAGVLEYDGLAFWRGSDTR